MTQPIFNVIFCIWEMVVGNFTPSVFIQGDFNTFSLLEILEEAFWSHAFLESDLCLTLEKLEAL